MVIYLGADHRGFKIKEFLKNFLKNKGYEAVDLGNLQYDENDDYPDFAAAVGEKVSLESETNRGILICGSGVGMDIAVNKFRGIRSALAVSPDQIYLARHEDNVNLLSLAADFLAAEEAQKITEVFLFTPFAGDEKYRRRISKISRIEDKTQQ